MEELENTTTQSGTVAAIAHRDLSHANLLKERQIWSLAKAEAGKAKRAVRAAATAAEAATAAATAAAAAEEAAAQALQQATATTKKRGGGIAAVAPPQLDDVRNNTVRPAKKRKRGRFLTKDASSSVLGAHGGHWWIEVEETKAIAKTSQALREGTSKIRSEEHTSITTNSHSNSDSHTNNTMRSGRVVGNENTSVLLKKRKRGTMTAESTTEAATASPSTSEESESDDGTVTIREDVVSFSQEEYHNLFVPKNPLEIAKGLQNTTVTVPPHLEDFFLPRPQPGDIVNHPRLEIMAKAAGISIKDLVKDLVEKQRKGEVEKEAFMKEYYLREYSPRHRLLLLISEHVTKFLARQDDLGSEQQLLNDNLNSLPDHKPNTSLHTLAIFFAHMIALKKVSDHTAAAAAAAAASNASSAAADARTADRRTPSSSASSAAADPRTEDRRTSSADTGADLQRTSMNLKTTGLEEVVADEGPKVGDDSTAVPLLSLDTLVETAVESINKGVIPKKLIEQLAVRFTSNKNLDSIIPLSKPLNRDRRESTQKGASRGDFHWDQAVEFFATLRLKTAHAVPPGKKYRPIGWVQNLEDELMSFAERHGRELPSGIYFVQSLDSRLKLAANSEKTKKSKADKIANNKERRADPGKRERDQETKNLYGSTQCGKDKKRKSKMIREAKELGILPPSQPHIDSLRLESSALQEFIHNKLERDCDTLTLRQVMERSLHAHSFIDIDGAWTKDHEEIYRIAAYSIEKKQWILMKKIITRWRIEWDSITFAKGAYVGYSPGKGAYKSKELAWIAMANHPESVVDSNLSVLQAQQKLRHFIGDTICIDYGGCDNYCLRGWNENLFGFDTMDQFDFGQTVNYGNPDVKSIFGPRIYTKEGEENTNTNKIIHSITGHLHIITDDLFVLNGRSWSKPVVPGSLCDPYLTCVKTDHNFSDVVLDVQRLINLFVAIRAAYNHTNNE